MRAKIIAFLLYFPIRNVIIKYVHVLVSLIVLLSGAIIMTNVQMGNVYFMHFLHLLLNWKKEGNRLFIRKFINS